MLFFHVVADYNLQGWLASAKQRGYWKHNAPDELYKHDYIMALIMHSISWTFMVMLPIAYINQFVIGAAFTLVFIANVSIHAIVDHMKANMNLISLCVDQFVHVAQIFITAICFLRIFN